MFAVMFELQPRPSMRDAYLDIAKELRSELESISGFDENIRYRSLTREDWMLSISMWEDERALLRWRTQMHHHDAQALGRKEILADYRLRVCSVALDTRPIEWASPPEPGEITTAGDATIMTVITATRPTEWPSTQNPYDCAEWLGFNPYCEGCVSWDVYQAVLTPGDLALVVTWHDTEMAEGYERVVGLRDGARLRRLSVLRDYGMFDRREAPQYFPDAAGAPTRHA